ncbi:ABC transporter permease subunit [uncultured Cohaesibacter sp.]|uniref:carbohydrate ABC transporter permease n=1 Tax=uncultured Cohaesibacter sp. TaxID=1002546 RepID=UPI0029C7D61F|nr:ABC transporter permease subunit [uncultured Cohaesibacter sp.]
MIENTRAIDRTAVIILTVGILFILSPLVFVVITATQSYDQFVQHNFSLIPGSHFFDNLLEVWRRTQLPLQTWNSFVVSLVAGGGRVTLAFFSAFAIVFFAARYRPLIYAAVLASIMLPLNLMVITAYQVAANVALPINAIANMGDLWQSIFGSQLDLQYNILESYAGIAIPLMAQGTATLILVQFMRTLPIDLARAATMDGAGPLRFMWDILLPLSRAPMISLFLYLFISAWVEYLWPLIAASTPEHQVAVVGLTRLDDQMEDAIPNYPLLMAGAIMVTSIPLILIAIFQRHIVRGLTLSEK